MNEKPLVGLLYNIASAAAEPGNPFFRCCGELSERAKRGEKEISYVFKQKNAFRGLEGAV
jgi:hypothetical protein